MGQLGEAVLWACSGKSPPTVGQLGEEILCGQLGEEILCGQLGEACGRLRVLPRGLYFPGAACRIPIHDREVWLPSILLRAEHAMLLAKIIYMKLMKQCILISWLQQT